MRISSITQETLYCSCQHALQCHVIKKSLILIVI